MFTAKVQFTDSARVIACSYRCLAASGSRSEVAPGDHLVAELCADAGFGTVRRVEMVNPFNILYEIST